MAQSDGSMGSNDRLRLNGGYGTFCKLMTPIPASLAFKEIMPHKKNPTATFKAAK